MLGPHFSYDLTRLARQPRYALLRAGYLAALLVGWGLVWIVSTTVPLDVQDFAVATRYLTQSILVLQYLFILILTPTYHAGAIVEDKECGMLELLFQTHLSDAEILFGKFAARTVHLALLPLSSMPLLAFISLWGGVQMETLALHLVALIVLILLVSSTSLFASVNGKSFGEAMAVAYAFVFVMVLFAVGVPMAMPWATRRALTNDFYTTFFSGAAIALVVSAAFFRLTLWQFSRLRNRTAHKEGREAPTSSTSASSADEAVPDRAILWKELRDMPAVGELRMLIWGVIALSVLLAIVHGVLGLLGLGIVMDVFRGVIVGYYVVSFLALLACAYGFNAFQATAAIARERERNTLEFLLMLPMDRRELLFWKGAAPWVHNRVLLLAILVMPILGVMSGMLSVWAGLMLLLLPWSGLLFISMLGLFLSVVCRRVLTANFILACVLVAMVFVELVLAPSHMVLLFGVPPTVPVEEGADPMFQAVMLVLGQQSLFLLGAIAFGVAAIASFNHAVSETRFHTR